MPADWVIVSQDRASSGAQYVLVRDTVSNEIGMAWMLARTANPADIPAMRRATIVGKPALSAVADYLQAAQQMVECLTWVDGERSRVLFEARMPAWELPGFQSRFDAIIQTAVVP